MLLHEFLNSLKPSELSEKLFMVCSSQEWVKRMMQDLPFHSDEILFELAEKHWFQLPEPEIYQAIAHHPRIGGKDQLREKFKSTRNWSSQEQAGLAEAEEAVLDGLNKGNDDYFSKFGFVFLICATGKSAAEILAALQQRIQNDKATEIKNATAEINQIIKIRLQKLVA